MTLHVAIALGHTNLNLPSIRKHLSRCYSERRFVIEECRPAAIGSTTAFLQEARILAEVMAANLGLKYVEASLCIAIMMVRFFPKAASLKPSVMDIAVMIEKGELQQKSIWLTPHTAHNAALGYRPHETHYDAEGCANLLTLIRQRSKALHLV